MVVFSLSMFVFCVLQESLAVVYAPSTPCLYTIYEPVIRLKGQAKTAVISQRPFSAKEVHSSVLEPQFLRTMMPCHAVGLHSVLHKIGGTGSFVFLFARVRLCLCGCYCYLTGMEKMNSPDRHKHRIMRDSRITMDEQLRVNSS